MPGISRLFGFGLFRDGNERSRMTYEPERQVRRVPFKCPECDGVKWDTVPLLECCGLREDRHTLTRMHTIEPEGAPDDTPGLRTGGDCDDE